MEIVGAGLAAPGPSVEGADVSLSGPWKDMPESSAAVVGAGAAVVGGVVDIFLFCEPVGLPLSITPCEAAVLGDTPTASLSPPPVGCESGTAPPPCILQVSPGAAKYESSVVDAPLGTINATLVVVGQFGVGKSPECEQTVTEV